MLYEVITVDRDRMAWQEIKVRSDTLLEQINESGFACQMLLEQLDESASIEVSYNFV